VEGRWAAPAVVLKPAVVTIVLGLVLRTLARLAEEDRLVLRKVLDEILGA
jgi:hypothetical protein